MSGYWVLTVSDEFSAAHALRNYKGKCENLHGHNFSVEVSVEGNELEPDTGMLLDFKLLKDILKTVLEKLDHKILNDLPAFQHENPSSELIARHIWKQMDHELNCLDHPSAKRASMRLVCVSETGKQSAAYSERPIQ